MTRKTGGFDQGNFGPFQTGSLRAGQAGVARLMPHRSGVERTESRRRSEAKITRNSTKLPGAQQQVGDRLAGVLREKTCVTTASARVPVVNQSVWLVLMIVSQHLVAKEFGESFRLYYSNQTDYKRVKKSVSRPLKVENRNARASRHQPLLRLPRRTDDSSTNEDWK